MALHDEAKQIIAKVFGPTNAARVDAFALEVNPDARPKEFLQKCIDLLAFMLGPNLAQEKFKDLLNRYH